MLSVDEVLERTQWDFFWLPEDARVVEREALLYSVCERDVLGLNVVKRTRAEPHRLPEAVDEVVQAHRRVQSRWMVTPSCARPELEACLSDAGYVRGHTHVASALEVHQLDVKLSNDLSARGVVDLAGMRDWIAVSNAAFGRQLTRDPRFLVRELAQCTGPGARVHRFVVYEGETPISSGGLSVFPELSFGFLWAGGTRPEARGRGGYRALLAARATRASELGLKRVGLYARVETSAPVVARVGFEEHGFMTYWERGADSGV